MEPVIGVDVAKGSSVIQAFLKRNEAYGRLESISHDEIGFMRLSSLLRELQYHMGMEPVVVLEATGHYHRGLVHYLSDQGWKHFIINPVQSKRARGTQLRKVKTDAADAWHLAEMYYRGDVKPHRTWEEAYTELQHVTRQHEFITGMFVQAKLNTRALLDQVFPSYMDTFSFTSLLVLQRCLKGHFEEVEKVLMDSTGKARSRQWLTNKVNDAKKMLAQWDRQHKSLSQVKVLEGMVSLLLEFSKQLNDLEVLMKLNAEELPEVDLVKSFRV